MKVPNYTAGNWHAHDGQIYPTETGQTLALIPYFDKDNTEQQANTQLIAAAPDLAQSLAELLYLGEQMELESGETDPTVEKARQALIKAGYTL